MPFVSHQNLGNSREMGKILLGSVANKFLEKVTEAHPISIPWAPGTWLSSQQVITVVTLYVNAGATHVVSNVFK